MPPKKKVEPNPKVDEFINKVDDNTSSDDEPYELVVQKVRTQTAPPVMDEVLPEPVKPKRVVRRKPKTPAVSPHPEGPDPLTSIQAELIAMREELARSKVESATARKQAEDVKKENVAIRKNEIDARREMMRLRFN